MRRTRSIERHDDTWPVCEGSEMCPLGLEKHPMPLGLSSKDLKESDPEQISLARMSCKNKLFVQHGVEQGEHSFVFVSR